MIEKNRNKKAYILIADGFIQNPGEDKQKKNILIHNGRIVDLVDDIPSGIENLEIINAENLLITPGLIDQHIHGGYGCDFNTSAVQEIIEFLDKLPMHGITSICPVIMTDTPEKIRIQAEKILQAKKLAPDTSAKILGINLEGPFLNQKYKGIHNDNLILKCSISNFQKIEIDGINIVTLAPELDSDFKLTKYLADKGIIASAGHSDCSLTTFYDSVKAGISQVTHVFNAMSPLNHREPGIICGAFLEDSINVEVIADHKHLHPDIIKLITRIKPESSIIFVSDSLPLNSSPEDSMIFGGHEIFKQGEIAVNKENRFAGSLMFLDSVIRKNSGLFKFADLLKYCTINPANNLKISDTGIMKQGMHADLVIWEEKTLEVKFACVNGRICQKS